MYVVGNEDLSPQIQLTSLDEIPRLLLEHRVVIRDGDELFIAKALGVSDISKIRITLLAELANNQRFI